MKRQRILVIEDDSAMRGLLEDYLALEGYRIEVSELAVSAIQQLKDDPNSFDLVISDINMPQMNGLEFVERFKRMEPGTPVILISAFTTPQSAIAARACGATAYLTKPFKLVDLKNAVTSALEPVA